MIRSVSKEDSQAITEIYNHYVTHSTATFDLTPTSQADTASLINQLAGEFPFLVYETEGEIAGYCYAHSWKSKAAYQHTWEITIYLSPIYTGKGIGKILLSELIAQCRTQGCKVLIADITAENKESCLFHESFGFQKVSHFRQVGKKFGRWLDVIDYQLVLS